MRIGRADGPTGLRAAAQSENRQQERREEHLDAEEQQRPGDYRNIVLRQSAEAVADPGGEQLNHQDATDQHQGSPEQQAMLEPVALAETVECLIALAKEIDPE